MNPAGDGSGSCGLTLVDPARIFITITTPNAIQPDLTITISPQMAGVITAMAPSFAYLDADSAELTVYGVDLVPGATIWFDGVELATQSPQPGTLTATVPAELLDGDARSVPVIVVAPPGPEMLTSNTAIFTISRRSSDVNCDGVSDATDALNLMHFLAGLPNNQVCNGDANTDRHFDIRDAVRVLAEVAGLVPAQPAWLPGPPPGFRTEPPAPAPPSSPGGELPASVFGLSPRTGDR